MWQAKINRCRKNKRERTEGEKSKSKFDTRAESTGLFVFSPFWHKLEKHYNSFSPFVQKYRQGKYQPTSARLRPSRASRHIHFGKPHHTSSQTCTGVHRWDEVAERKAFLMEQEACFFEKKAPLLPFCTLLPTWWRPTQPCWQRDLLSLPPPHLNSLEAPRHAHTHCA